MCVYIHKSIHARMKLYFTPDWPVRCEFNFILNSYDFVSARRTTSADLSSSSVAVRLSICPSAARCVRQAHRASHIVCRAPCRAAPHRAPHRVVPRCTTLCLGSSQCLLSSGRYLLFVSDRFEGNVDSMYIPARGARAYLTSSES